MTQTDSKRRNPKPIAGRVVCAHRSGQCWTASGMQILLLVVAEEAP
ncbi:MAG: hypothetical protein GXY55_15560 [Phycisphaerae bacterium]|nr:hypothetical protein [Phycisphaerae bacterium]